MTTTPDAIREALEKAKARYQAMPPIERAIHDMEQKRSLSRGLSDFDRHSAKTDRSINSLPEFVVLDELKRLRSLPPAQVGGDMDVHIAHLEDVIGHLKGMQSLVVRGYQDAINDLGNKGDYERKDWSEPYNFLKSELARKLEASQDG